MDIYIMSIVGIILNSSGLQKPVYWKNYATPPIELNLNGADGGGALGINNLGQIVGYIGNNYNIELSRPVFWASSTTRPIELNLKGADGGVAYGINNVGQIVGYITNSSAEQKPVYWKTPTTPPIELNLNGASNGFAIGINNVGQIVGTTFNSSGLEKPVYWETSTSRPIELNLNGASGGIANGINNVGQIVGTINNTVNSIVVLEKPVFWKTPTAPPIELNGASSGAASGINNLGQIVGLIGNSSGLAKPVYWETPTTPPIELNLNGAIGGFGNGIADPQTPSPTPISNICFPAGTPVKTDQGIVTIELLDKHRHTINKHTILHVTRTVTLDNYLISFEKNALKRGCPSKKTIMSKDHMVEFEGRMAPAYRFLDYSDQVKKVKYTGEVLYNVLLAHYGKMEVNNLVCETLHPENIIAKLYTGNYMEDERTAIVNQLNNSLKTKDLCKYKYAVDNLLRKGSSEAE
jgi:hypothetical protein